MKKTYLIDTPPPTVSGQLHMGHIFSYSHIDFIARYKRKKQHNVVYPMGFDDNGLPTEKLIEGQLGYKANSDNKNQFLAKCKKICDKAELEFKNLFQSMDFASELDSPYQTISDHSNKIATASFIDLFEKGLVFQKEAPTYWDTNFKTALSQADIEEKEKDGTAHNIIFFITDKDGNLQEETIEIMTTRPEMLPACQAVFYNPNDSRYNGTNTGQSGKIQKVDGNEYEISNQNLKDKFCVIPGKCHKIIPIIADEDVKQDKGTGLVMCCTFGDAQDIDWARKHKLSSYSWISNDGYVYNRHAHSIATINTGNIDKIHLQQGSLDHCLHDLKLIAVDVVKAENKDKAIEFINKIKQWSADIANKVITIKESSEQQKHFITEHALPKGLLQAYKVINAEVVQNILQLPINQQADAWLTLDANLQSVKEARKKIVRHISDLPALLESIKAESEGLLMLNIKNPNGAINATEMLEKIIARGFTSMLTCEQKMKHPVKCSERTGEAVEIIQSRQWYIDFGFHNRAGGMQASKFKSDMLAISQQINFHPANMRIKLEKWIEGINQDWCISRNRFLGIKIPKPLLFINNINNASCKLLTNPETKIPLLEHALYKHDNSSYIKAIYGLKSAIASNQISKLSVFVTKQCLTEAIDYLQQFNSPIINIIINALSGHSLSDEEISQITNWKLFEPAKYVLVGDQVEVKPITFNEGQNIYLKRFRNSTTQQESTQYCTEDNQIVGNNINHQDEVLLGEEPNAIQDHSCTKEYQVFDTWFTSSLTPQLSAKKLNGCDKLNAALVNSFETIDESNNFKDQQRDEIQMDLRPQAHEIIRTWTFYTIAKFYLHNISSSSQTVTNPKQLMPWSNIMLSGWCLANDGDKMSKSKGNIIDPTKIIATEGSNALRYWTSTAHLGQDTRFNRDALKESKKLLKKIKSVLNLLNSLPIAEQSNSYINNNKINDGNYHNYITTDFDKHLIAKLQQAIADSDAKLAEYQYSHARNIIESFFWNDLCDNYIEIAKARLYGTEGNAYVAIAKNYDQKFIDDFEVNSISAYLTIKYALQATMAIMHIYMPTGIEEIVSDGTNITLNNLQVWPQITIDSMAYNSQMVENGLQIIAEVRKIKAQDKVSVKREIAHLSCDQWLVSHIEDFDLRTVINAIHAKITTQASFAIDYTPSN